MYSSQISHDWNEKNGDSRLAATDFVSLSSSNSARTNYASKKANWRLLSSVTKGI
jgi:hypothetical protein